MQEKWPRPVYIINNLGNLEEIDPQIYISHYSSLKRIAVDFLEQLRDLPPGSKYGLWIHGASGTGKTSAVVNSYPNHYRKGANKWWDGYQGEPIVCFDDFDPEMARWATRFLKIWADMYTFLGEVKGGTRSCRPERFIITSQYTIEQCWGEGPAREAILRRFITVEKTSIEQVLDLTTI